MHHLSQCERSSTWYYLLFQGFHCIPTSLIHPQLGWSLLGRNFMFSISTLSSSVKTRRPHSLSLSLLEHQVEPESGPDCPSIDFALTLAGCWRRCWTVQERDKTPVSPGSTVEAGLARSGGDHGRTTIPRQGDSHSVITPPVLQVRTTRSTIIRGEGRGWGRLHLWKNEVRGQLLCSCRVSIFLNSSKVFMQFLHDISYRPASISRYIE